MNNRKSGRHTRPDALLRRVIAMTRFSSSVVLLIVLVTASPSNATAQDAKLPSPLSLADVIRIAGERRDKIQAARARTAAGEARPTIVSALSDPCSHPHSITCRSC